MKPLSTLKRKRSRQLQRRRKGPSKLSLKTTRFFYREKPAAHVIQTRRERISRESEPTRVHVSNARNAADATAAEIAADSADAAGVRMDVPTVHIAAEIVVQIADRTVVRIAVGIAAGDASSAGEDTAHIGGIMGGTHLHDGHN
jgi:hypothetical protein